MSRMPFIRDLKARGVICDLCMPFAYLDTAWKFASRNPSTPVVMDFKGSNQGAWLVVSEADAVRLEEAGFVRAPMPDSSPPLNAIGK